MIRKHHADEAMFAIVNGDVIYEERRDGTLNGVRDNYKLYFSRGRSFSSLFRHTPALFTFDDHDVGWDIHGCGQIGLGEGRHLIRDLGLRGYEEYLSWANYHGPQTGRVLFGHGKVTASATSCSIQMPTSLGWILPLSAPFIWATTHATRSLADATTRRKCRRLWIDESHRRTSPADSSTRKGR